MKLCKLKISERTKDCHCVAMARALEETPAKIGFTGVTTINIKTRISRYIGIRYIGNSKDKQGTMLNYCPFCGESLQWWKPEQVSKMGITDRIKE